MTPTEVRKLLDVVTYPGYTWRLDVREQLVEAGGTSMASNAEPYRDMMLLSASFEAPNNVTGAVETQRTRKWYISPHATPSEVVQTCLKLVLTSVEHEARERFIVDGRALFDPHHPLDGLATLAGLPRDSRPA